MGIDGGPETSAAPCGRRQVAIQSTDPYNGASNRNTRPGGSYEQWIRGQGEFWVDTQAIYDVRKPFGLIVGNYERNARWQNSNPLAP